MRVIDEQNNKVLKVVKLDKVTSASITDNIRDIVGRKYSLKDYKIDEIDLGSKMSKLLRDIYNFQKTGVLPEPTQAKPIEGKPTQSKLAFKKPARQPDSFWSAYSTAVTQPTQFVSDTSTVEADINFIKTPENTGNTATPEQKEELDESLSILGVNCPVCGAEVDLEAEKCPHCGTKID